MGIARGNGHNFKIMDTTTVKTRKQATKIGGYCSTTLHARRDKRRREADIRQAKYDGLTTEEKIATLIPGGSKRQRARLEKVNETKKTKKVKA